MSPVAPVVEPGNRARTGVCISGYGTVDGTAEGLRRARSNIFSTSCDMNSLLRGLNALCVGADKGITAGSSFRRVHYTRDNGLSLLHGAAGH